MTDRPILIADIGGTNARFALAREDGRGFERVISYPCSTFDGPESAIAAYLGEVGISALSTICIAAAGPVIDGEVSFTNSGWTLSVNQLRESCATDEVQIFNDFAGKAHALPFLNDDDLMALGSHSHPDLSQADFTVAVIGPGTGLGVAGLASRNGHHAVLETEGGHVGFAPETDQQSEVLDVLRNRFGRVSDERLVSGQGVENIFWALSGADSEDFGRISAAEIFRQIEENPTGTAAHAVDLFYEILGQVAGNVALVMGAFDGVFVAGGVAQGYPEQLQSSAFRTGFERKGRHADLMRRIPTQLVLHPHFGVLGAYATALSQQ